MEITNQKQIKEIAERFGVAPNKSFGQNFLLDGGVLTKIANAAFKDGAENVLEVGPGMGALTDKLCRKAKKVVAVEIDGGMVQVLSHTLSEYSNVEIINGDILDKKIQEQAINSIGKPFAICANLPYYITTPIIMAFLEGGYDFSSMVLMMQKEVAERICAAPGSKSYGVLSLCMSYYADVEMLFTVSPNCFFPKPKVDSMVIRILKLKKPRISVKDEKLLFRVIKAAFAMRRKTLANNLCNAFSLSKEQAYTCIKNCGLKEGIRGEALTLTEFGLLADEIFSKTVE